ncbi:uncharacterized protein LOC130053564 [Ostrea edulis]|uniref:uncharacterized protein LOC130053564 n=1 Tax=Ostrea edulis TaxID=37623 RepID=UPI0024AF4090|nr:uncharacterized protein LOC130053564 [Ostrea edulis]
MADGVRKSVYICRVHLTDLLPLYCRNCDCPICCVCVVKNHKGHNICNVSECVEKKADELNDAIQQKDSACFDVKLIEENLRKRQESLQFQTESIIRSVEDREREIVAEVRNVCRQTIERVGNLTTEVEGRIRQDEDVLHRFLNTELFRNVNDDDCIKSVYFYNELKRLVREHKRNMEDGIPFQFVAPILSSEHLCELFGCVLTDDHVSSDATVGEDDCGNHIHADVNNAMDTESSSSISKEEFLECQIYDYRKRLMKTGIEGVIPISSDRSILYSGGSLYHYNRNSVHKIVEEVGHFTYVPETDEVAFILKGQKKVFRQPSNASQRRSLLVTLHCEKVLCIGHDYENYITLVISLKEKESFGFQTNYYVCNVNDSGCVPTKQNVYIYGKTCRLKLQAFSLVQIQEDKISVHKGYSGRRLFSYSGCVGNEPSSTFKPSDVCTDTKNNFLVIDSYDNTVHLLNPKGKPLRVIMLAEDGLCGVNCIAMDEFDWLWLGCKDGALHFANYQYFKTTTRKERHLMKQN